MRIVFVSNFINHHQVYLADELYKLTERNYYFIETEQMPNSFKELGYPDFSMRPYIIRAWESTKNKKLAMNLCLEADVMIFGGPGTLKYAMKRNKTGGITFEIGERCLKRGLINIFSPHLLKSLALYNIRFKKNGFRALCCSAYSAKDWNMLGAYKNKCYKWGYFTKTPDIDINDILKGHQGSSKIKILYVSRFLILKHPEMPVMLAKELKEKGYDFEINMYGNGPLKGKIKKLISELNLTENVHLKGTVSNDEILFEMRNHQIFLFTSDKHEGWGAVVNEAMSNGCVVVGSNAIGSIPFLITPQRNGMIFENLNQDDFNSKVKFLIDNPQKRAEMAILAYQVIHNVWSPQNAAKRLISLCEGILSDKEILFTSGPCSRS